MFEQKFEYARITICLTDGDEDSRTVYDQTIPLNAIAQYEPLWLRRVISTMNNLEVKNV